MGDEGTEMGPMDELLGKRVAIRWEQERTSARGIVLPTIVATQDVRQLRVARVVQLGADVPEPAGYEVGGRVLVASYGQEAVWGPDDGSAPLYVVQHEDVVARLRELQPAGQVGDAMRLDFGL